MSIQLELVDSDRKIGKDINRAIVAEMNRLVVKNRPRVENNLKIAVEKWIRTQPEIASLLSDGTPGTLNAQFGLPQGQSDVAVSNIISSILSSIKVTVRQFDERFKGGVDFEVQRDNFQQLLRLESGITESESGPLHWLDWLLVKGGKTIVYGYSYTPDLSGRSGGGVMESGGFWRVPPQYAGVMSDNFITRALKNRNKELQDILQGVLDNG